MSDTHQFCDHCELCRPALLDMGTGKVFSDDSPVMIAVNKIWNNDSTYAQRKAFIAVTVHNSRLDQDMRLAHTLIDKFKAALTALDGTPT